MLLLLHWPVFPEFAIARDAWVYPMCLAGEREAWSGLGSWPVGPFEESRRCQYKEATSMPCGLRKLQETQNKAASTRVKRTTGMPPLNIRLAHRAQNHPLRQELFHPLTFPHLGPEQSAAIRWRGGEKRRIYRSFLPQCRQAPWLKWSRALWRGK